ncbi:MAG: biopolymer transporter ExbD [Alistipes sp.]|nr:biopolymer transporter ExbD [Alistipes sp.]
MIRYILEFMLCSALFYALYRLLLEGRTAHRAARAYLVGSMLLAVVIPMLELPLYPADTIYYEVPIITLAEPQAVTVAANAVTMPHTVDWWQVLMAVVVALYAIIAALNLGRMAWRIVLIHRLRQRSQLTFYEAYTLAENDAVREPFSFWRTIFLSRVYTPREREQIIAHEASHVRHQHTAERLTLEALRCVAWFNPFVWVTATALVEVQEWEADQDVLHQGYDVYEYRQLIFRQLFGYTTDITCGLKSQTSKKRFLMMTTTKRGKLSLVRYGAVIPLVAAMILAFGAVRAEAVAEEPTIEPTVETPTPPDEAKSEVYISAEGKIFFNGEEMTLDELRSSLEKLRAAKGAGMILTIKADDKTAVGMIDDVKEVARTAQVLRIKYDVPLGGEMTVNVLPPKTTAEPNAKIQVMEYIADSNNLLTLFINARGLVLTTRPDGTQAVVDLAELKSIIKAFVDNSESVGGKRQVKNPNYADFTWQTIKRGDGEVHYPVSNGVISLVTVRDTPADKYMEIQEVIITAYAELREELSQSSFGKSFESLDIDERRFIMRAIPVKVSEVGQSSNADAPKTL